MGKCRTSHCNQWGLCRVIILFHEGWRHCSSQITLEFLVTIIIISFGNISLKLAVSLIFIA